MEFHDKLDAARHFAGYCQTCETAGEKHLENLQKGTCHEEFCRCHVESVTEQDRYFQPILDEQGNLLLLDSLTFARLPPTPADVKRLHEQWGTWWGGQPSTWEGGAKISRMTCADWDMLRLKVEQLKATGNAYQ